MTDTLPFATDILLAAAAGFALLVAHRVSDRAGIPFSALALAITAVAVAGIPGAHHPSQEIVNRIVTVSLVVVLFAGGMNMGGRRFRGALGPILALGVPGTFATAGLTAMFVHYALGFGWYVALLLGTAVAPTDPTVVFSVLGRRRVAGRSGTILEGESGTNDPVGIALMASLVTAGALTGRGGGHAAVTFLLQMAVGAAIGVAGGHALVWVMRRTALPVPGLDPIQTTVGAFLLYGLAGVAHGSGFLAVFVAGIVLGDQNLPRKSEIDNFHDALASLGEMAAFVALGLTVDLGVLARFDVWGPGVAIGAAMAIAVRPAVVAACLIGSDLTSGERRFVQFAGLKGAVPILLGGYLSGTGLAGTDRLYGIVIVVVALSVVVQGSLVGPAISILGLPTEVQTTPRET